MTAVPSSAASLLSRHTAAEDREDTDGVLLHESQRNFWKCDAGRSPDVAVENKADRFAG